MMKLVDYIEDEKDPIFVEIFNEFINLSQNENGVNVIKSIVAVLKSEEAQAMIIKKILEDPFKFMEHQISNYAFQHVIASWDLKVTRPLFEVVRNNVSYLSIQKYASNSIECVMKHAPEDLIDEYMKEVKENIVGRLLRRSAEQLLRAFRGE